MQTLLAYVQEPCFSAQVPVTTQKELKGIIHRLPYWQFTVCLQPILQIFDENSYTTVTVLGPRVFLIYYGFRKGHWRYPVKYIYALRVVRIYIAPPPPNSQGPQR